MMPYKRKSLRTIQNDISQLHYLRMHAYVDTFREMLYEIWKEPGKKITKSELEKLFADNVMYPDYVNMLRKKYMFMRAYHALEKHEALFLVSGITRNFNDKETNIVKPYSQQTYIYSKNQKASTLYEPSIPTYTKIIMMVEDETGYTYIDLPPNFSKRLIDYLSSYDPAAGDCNDFELHMLHTDAFSYSELIWPESWDGDLSDLHIGDCISLLPSKNSTSKHKAVYLGHGLFISKFGRVHIGVSTLQQMHDFYDTKYMTLNRYFRDTQTYADMKANTAKMLETHPDGERLKKVFANVGKGGFC